MILRSLNKMLFANILSAIVLISNQAYSSNFSATATATIITSLEINELISLRFGSIAPGSAISTILIDPLLPDSSSRSITSGDAILLSSSHGRALFEVVGEPLFDFAITLPTSSITISNGAFTMDVDLFMDSVGAPPEATLSALGSFFFSVGAALTVGIGQDPGTYSGPFIVSVDYV